MRILCGDVNAARRAAFSTPAMHGSPLTRFAAQLALHVDGVEPFPELEADRFHPPRVRKAARAMETYRRRLAAADDSDHLPEAGLPRRFEQALEQALSDPLSKPLRV